jgi:hypothetical protein
MRREWKTSRQSASPRTKELPAKGFVSQCRKRVCPPANTYTPALYRKYVGGRHPAPATHTVRCRGEVRFKNKTILESAVVCNSMPHDINDEQRHDEPCH